MHPLSCHLDFGVAESFDLLVSCPIPSVHPFFFQILVGWQPGSSPSYRLLARPGNPGVFANQM